MDGSYGVEDGTHTRYVHDALGRLVEVQYGSGSPVMDGGAAHDPYGRKVRWDWPSRYHWAGSDSA